MQNISIMKDIRDIETEEDKKGLSAAWLKIIAVITMLIDHTAAVLLDEGYFYLYEPSQHRAVVLIELIMRCIGRLAFPIFCFLLVEGYIHTRNKWKYFLNLLIFGLISELPFDLAVFRKPIDFSYNNTLLDLALSLLAVILWDIILKSDYKNADWRRKTAAILTVIWIAAVAQLINLDYGFAGPLATVAMYILRKDEMGRGITSMLIFLLSSPAAIFAAVDLGLFHVYNGKRGKQLKYLFYAFYPVHLAVLVLIRYMIFKV